MVNKNEESLILEIKSTNGNAKSAKTVLAHPDHYGKTKLIRIKESKIGYVNDVLTISHYMAYLLFNLSSIFSV